MVTGGLGAMSLAVSAADNSVAAKKNALKVVGGVLLLSVASDIVDMTQESAVSTATLANRCLFNKAFTCAHSLKAARLLTDLPGATPKCPFCGLPLAAATHSSANFGNQCHAGCAVPLAVFTQGQERLNPQVLQMARRAHSL